MSEKRQLLCEYYRLCEHGYCVDILTESEKKYIQDGGLYLSGTCQRANAKNQNGRIYRRDILEREVERYQQLIKEKRSCGALDHPTTEIVELRDASHLVTSLFWKGDDLICKLKVLKTPSGEILKSLVSEGILVGISSRGLGSVQESRNGTIVQDDFSLVAFDIVSEPSTVGAFMREEGTGASSSVNLGLNENKQNKINKLLKGILED